MNAISGRAEVFPIGPPVAPEHQVGRLGDIERVAEALRGGDHVVLSDERRAGKSTVALGALDLLTSGDLPPVIVAVNLHDGFASSGALATEIVRQVSVQRSRAASAGFKVRHLAFGLWSRTKDVSVPGVTDQDEIKAVKALTDLLHTGNSDVEKVQQSFGAMDRLASERGVPAVVFIDEAQEIDKWPDGDELQRALKTLLRASRRQSTFLFAGSEPSMMTTLFGHQGLLAFDGQHLPLSPVHDDLARQDLRRSFSDLGHGVTPRALDMMLMAADGQLLRLMMIANRADRITQEVEQAEVDEITAEAAIREARGDRLWRKVS